MKITKDDIRKLKAGARREIDIEEGIGLNRKRTVTVDKKKKMNKEKCRNKSDQ